MQYPAYIYKQDVTPETTSISVYVPDVYYDYPIHVKANCTNEAFEAARVKVALHIAELVAAGKSIPPVVNTPWSKNYYFKRSLFIKDPPRKAPFYFSYNEEINRAKERTGISQHEEIFVESMDINEGIRWTFVHLVCVRGGACIRAYGEAECGAKDKFDPVTGVQIAIFRAMRRLAAALDVKPKGK